MGSPASIVPLYEYQKRWVEDRSRFKCGRWSRQAGKTFAATLEIAVDLLGRGSRWAMLSSGERMSRENMETLATHLSAIGEDVKLTEGELVLDDGVFRTHEIRLTNRGRAIGLPANPATARGLSANVYLDEFAVHKDSRKIWAALFPTITRGYKIRITSTPQGKQNKFYELATNPKYAQHVLSIWDAVAQGLDLRDEDGNPTTPEDLRAALADEEAWVQEYEVQFLDEATAWLPYELIAEAEDLVLEAEPAWAKALVTLAQEAHAAQPGAVAPLGLELPAPPGEVVIGVDIGRRRDLTVIWILWDRGQARETAAVIELARQPFGVQERVLWTLLTQLRVRRACLDASGLGMQLAERAQERFGAYRVEAVTFTQAAKEALAVGLKMALEDRRIRIPAERRLRESLHSLKRYQTATGNFRFDADRSESTGHCYDEQTEILTADGWKRFEKLSPDDQVATLEDGRWLRFVPPVAIQREFYEGAMLAVRNTQIDLLVTPEHRMYARFPREDEFSICRAGDLLEDRRRIEFKKDAEWQGHSPAWLRAAGEDVEAAAWARFVGYFLSQGFTSTSYRVGIYGRALGESEVTACLARLPWRFWLETNSRSGIQSYRIKNKRLWATLSPLGRQWDRHIPREMFGLDRPLLIALFQGLMWGNGSRGPHSAAYHTSSRRLADDFQELLLRIGLAGSISIWQPSLKGKNRRTMYRININQTRLTPQINKRRRSVSLEQYVGYTYCCTVPSGVIYVRRHGKAVWCGNSDAAWALALALQAAHQPVAHLDEDLAALGGGLRRPGKPTREADRGPILAGLWGRSF